eukprot:538775_1
MPLNEIRFRCEMCDSNYVHKSWNDLDWPLKHKVLTFGYCGPCAGWDEEFVCANFESEKGYENVHFDAECVRCNRVYGKNIAQNRYKRIGYCECCAKKIMMAAQRKKKNSNK